MGRKLCAINGEHNEGLSEVVEEEVILQDSLGASMLLVANDGRVDLSGEGAALDGDGDLGGLLAPPLESAAHQRC